MQTIQPMTVDYRLCYIPKLHGVWQILHIPTLWGSENKVL